MKQVVNVSSKSEIKAAVSFNDGRFNYFEGDIRKLCVVKSSRSLGKINIFV